MWDTPDIIWPSHLYRFRPTGKSSMRCLALRNLIEHPLFSRRDNGYEKQNRLSFSGLIGPIVLIAEA